MPEAIWISFAFVIGLLVKGIGLPPLVGYLAAGFVLSGLSATTSITAEPTDVLAHIAHLGVLLLLFTVGLKLKLRSIVSPEVIGGSLLHFAITCVVFAPPGLYLLFDLDWTTALMLAIALSFSSTVLAAKVLESKRELRAFHGRVAIGILIMQDLIALVVMSLAAGKHPQNGPSLYSAFRCSGRCSTGCWMPAGTTNCWYCSGFCWPGVVALGLSRGSELGIGCIGVRCHAGQPSPPFPGTGQVPLERERNLPGWFFPADRH